MMGSTKLYEIAKKTIKKFKEKRKARECVMRAILRGSLTRGKFCAKCQRQERLDAHHEDYSKPLDVIWLCRPCHSDIHKRAHKTYPHPPSPTKE